MSGSGSESELPVAGGGAEGTESAVEGEEGSNETISVYGSTAQRCTTLASVTLSLIVGTGERDGGEMVLVPYVECELVEDTAGTSETKTLSWVLTLDNVAFLVEEFATDLAALIAPLNNMAQGDIRPAHERIEYAVQCMARANSQLASAADGLRQLLASR